MSRYPGTRPFSDSPDDVMRFFGREAEAEELYLRVLSVPLLVQFGNSGLGKTSLLQAGLFPRLRQKPFLPVMIRLNNAEESLTAAVARAIRESAESEGIEATHRSTEGLWELLSSTTVWRDDLLLTPVLVFDQFEEVFTLRDAAFRAEIASELGALASGIPPARAAGTRRPAVKVLISLREDYLGALEEFSAAIPGLFQERLRLGPLTEEAARDAIAGPAGIVGPDLSPPFEFEPAALDLMVEELKGKSGVIEPFQLQLLARHAETVAARKGGGRLTPEDFRGAQDFESVLKNFYRDTLQRLPQRAKAQQLIEEGLLGAAGHRLMLEERQIQSDYGVTAETLQTLEHSRLIRRERRLESVFYEISHDRIADSIFRNRTARLPRKVRQMLWAAAAVALLIVVGLAVAHYRVSRERDAAERWVSLLLGEEFFGELRDSGRTTVSQRLQDQILAESKAGLGTPVTRGLALRNHGDLQRLDGTLTDALKAYGDAMAELEAAPRDATSMREIARTHDRIGAALLQQGRLAQALQHHDAAVAAWRDVVGQKSQLVNDDCMGLAESLTAAAGLNGRMGRNDVALRHNDDAFDIAFGASFDTASRCGRRPGTVQPDPDVRAMSVLARIALVHHDLTWDMQTAEGAVVLATRARELSPPSIKATALAMEAIATRSVTRYTDDATLRDYREVLEQLRTMQLWDVDNREWQANRARMRVVIADLLAECILEAEGCRPGVLDDAEIMVADAEAVLRTLSAHDPTSLSLHQDLVAALRTHGKVLAARGPEFRDKSMARFDEAERLHTGRRHEPSDPTAAQGMVALLSIKAAAYLALGDTEQNTLTLERIEDVLERAVTAYPNRSSFVARLYNVRTALAWSTGNDAAAATATAGAQEALAQLVERGRQHRVTASELLKKNEPAAALRELNASEAALHAGIRRTPSYPVGYAELAETYLSMNEAFARLGRPEEQLYALAGATTAAQLRRWLAAPEERHDANEQLLTARNVLSTALVQQNRWAQSLEVLESVVSLGQEFLAEPTPDGAALGLIGDAKSRIARIQRDSGSPSWRDTLEAGLIYLRKASAVDPQQTEKLRFWTDYASEGAAATASRRPSGSTRP
ncbi:MAG TPA: tetratricopeptide repeat protein [Thermoanaerobaculia bacterium]|nr:tetratricopeptide repeat protein [Thermoanaerobaculia bacterium]